MENNGQIFLENLQLMKDYYYILLRNIEKTEGIYNIVFTERLVEFIAPNRKIDYELLCTIYSDIEYVSELIRVYLTMSDEEKKLTTNRLGEEVNRKATAMTEYLTFLQYNLKKAILDNYTPFHFGSDDLIIEKEPKEKLRAIEKVVETFVNNADSYQGESYILKNK